MTSAEEHLLAQAPLQHMMIAEDLLEISRLHQGMTTLPMAGHHDRIRDHPNIRPRLGRMRPH